MPDDIDEGRQPEDSTPEAANEQTQAGEPRDMPASAESLGFVKEPGDADSLGFVKQPGDTDSLGFVKQPGDAESLGFVKQPGNAEPGIAGRFGDQLTDAQSTGFVKQAAGGSQRDEVPEFDSGDASRHPAFLGQVQAASAGVPPASEDGRPKSPAQLIVGIMTVIIVLITACYAYNEGLQLLGDPDEAAEDEVTGLDADVPVLADVRPPLRDDTQSGQQEAGVVDDGPTIDRPDALEHEDGPSTSDTAGPALANDSGAPVDPGGDPVSSSPLSETPGLASTGAIEVDTPGDPTGEQPGLPVCDDGNPRTVDLRDPNGLACVYQPIVCDDGDPATIDYYDLNLEGCAFLSLPPAPPPADDPPPADNPPADEPPADEPPEDDPPADDPPADEDPPQDDPPPGPVTLVEDFSDDTDPAQPGLSDGAIQHDFSDAGWTIVDETATPLSGDYPSGPHAVELLTATDTVTFPGESVEHVALSYSTEFTGAAQVLVTGASDSKTFDLTNAPGWQTVEVDATDLGDNGIAVGEILALELSGAEVFYDDIEITVS
jgi:hypothetical protein